MKKPRNKLDPNVEGSPNDHLLGELEQWDSAVIKNAAYFTVCKMTGPARHYRQVVVYRTFLEAHQVAGNDRQTLIYALTHEGRSCCIPRALYADVAVMWHQPHVLGYPNEVFRSFGEGPHPDWYAYSNGRTTGPWPTVEQAELVVLLMNCLAPEDWARCSPSDRATVTRTVTTLNEKLKEQGREPLVVPQ